MYSLLYILYVLYYKYYIYIYKYPPVSPHPQNEEFSTYEQINQSCHLCSSKICKSEYLLLTSLDLLPFVYS